MKETSGSFVFTHSVHHGYQLFVEFVGPLVAAEEGL